MTNISKNRWCTHAAILCTFFISTIYLISADSKYKAVQTLIPWIPGTTTYGSSYGLDMRINGDYLFVNDKTDMPLGIPFCSAIYVYKRINGEWVNNQIISTEGIFDLDGDMSIEAQGDWLMFSLVGTPAGEDKAQPDFQGSVQIYKLNQSNGQYEFFQALDGNTPGLSELTAFGISGFPFDLSPSSLTVQAGAGFGNSLSLDLKNRRLLVGAPFQPTPDSSAINPGATYAFELGHDGFWHLTQTIYSPDGPSNYDRFGIVVIKGDHALISNGNTLPIPKVGACLDTGNSTVYVYRFNKHTNAWEFTGQRLTGDQTTLPVMPTTTIPIADAFGSVIAIHKKWLFVAAPFESLNPTEATMSGAVYIYKFEKKHGVKQYVRKQKIHSDVAQDFGFGLTHINASKRRAVISDSSRPGPGNIPYQGGVLVLKLKNGKWKKEETLFDPDGFVNNGFGVGAEIQGNTIVGGTWPGMVSGFISFGDLRIGPPYQFPYFLTFPPTPGKVVIFEKK